mgnify:CR=1 FL=1
MKKRPLIGVTTSVRKGRLQWLCVKFALWLAGAKAVRMTALQNDVIECYDGFIIAGGADIDPAMYGQENSASMDIEPERDTLEKKVIEYAIVQNRPILGICRGLQMINVVKGGSLHQQARDYYEHFVPTHSVLGRIFVRRQVSIVKDSLLEKICSGLDRLKVNSIHHQAINTLAPGLKIAAHDDHQLIQAIENTSNKEPLIFGVQWHPEFMVYKKQQLDIFKMFVRAVNSRQDGNHLMQSE